MSGTAQPHLLPGVGLPQRLERPLAAALGHLRQAWAGADRLLPLAPAPLPALAQLEVPLAEAWRGPTVELPLAAAVGRIAARPLCPYPRGSPCCCPGNASIAPAWPGWRGNGSFGLVRSLIG